MSKSFRVTHNKNLFLEKNLLVRKLLFIILVFFGFIANSQEVTKGHLDLRKADFSQYYDLRGEWEFYPGKFLGPKDFKSTSPLAGVKYVKVPAKKPCWKGGCAADTGYGTYRLIIYLPPKKQLYALEFQYIYSAAKIFANNNLVTSFGKLSKHKKNSQGVYYFDYAPVVAEFDSAHKDYIQLIIQVSDFAASAKFGLTQDIYFGTYKTIKIKNTKEIIWFFIVLGIVFFTFIYHLFIFFYYPARREALFISLVSIALIFRAIFTNMIFLPPVDFNLAHKIAFITAAIIPMFLFMVYYSGFPVFFKKSFKKIIIWITTFLLIYYLFFPPITFDSLTSQFLPVIFFLFTLYPWFVLLYYVFKKKHTSYLIWALLAQTILISAFVNDILFYLRIINTGYISHFAFGIVALLLTIFSSSFFGVLFKENIKLKARLEKQNEILEIKVKERTKELEEKNQELKKLSIIASETQNMVAIFDRDLTLEWMNKSFEKTYNIKLEDAIGIVKLDKFSNYPDFQNILNEYLKKGKSVKYQKQIQTNGKTRWIQVNLTPLLDEDNDLNKIICIQTDITDIKEYQHELFLKNTEIESNIRYALNIQKAVLPEMKSFIKYFDYFLLFMPKHIVSGDFYWYKKLYSPDGEYFMVAIVDCTGHGVPGAFMSLIATRMLEDLISYQRKSDPAEILQILNKEVLEALRQEETKNTDGFDIILTKIEKHKQKKDYYKLTYAAASMFFYIYHQQDKNIKRYKGDVYHIGGVIANKNIKFRNFEVDIYKKDKIYLLSDGYILQINEKNQKFSYLRLMDLLYKIAEKPFDEQKEILEKTFLDWKNGTVQRDDITILGLTPKF